MSIGTSNIGEFTSPVSLAAGIELYFDEGFKLTGRPATDKLVVDLLKGEAEIPNNIATHHLVRKIRHISYVLAQPDGFVLMKADHCTRKLTLLVDGLT